jgi:hypothetical protein
MLMTKKRTLVTKTRRPTSDSKIKTITTVKPPGDKEVASELGAAQETWDKIITNLTPFYGKIDVEWKASKTSFGWTCLLKHKKRTLVYLTPEKEQIQVGIVLGDRAVALALASRLPRKIKTLITKAPKYGEGTGIRLRVKSGAEVPAVIDLVVMKTTPK